MKWSHSGCSGHAVDALNTVDAVGVGARRSTHTVHSAIWMVGTITFSSKRSTHTVDTVNAVDAVGVGGKRSMMYSAVYSPNMGGGDHYL